MCLPKINGISLKRERKIKRKGRERKTEIHGNNSDSGNNKMDKGDKHENSLICTIKM